MLLAATLLLMHSPVDDLRHDDVDWNAMRAMREIERMDDPPLVELHRALDSDDWQQRQMAADLLWWFLNPPSWEDSRAPRGTVSTRLFEVTIEGLRSDALPYDRASQRYTYVFNGAGGFHNMVPHAKQAAPLLLKALESDDRQKRFLAALTLGFGHVSQAAEPVARVLLPHLRDNDIPEDAKWATHALYGLGPAVIPMLRAARPEADDQQRDLIDLIILDLTDPPLTRADFEERRELNDIASSVFDPAVQRPNDSMWWLRALSRPVRPEERTPDDHEGSGVNDAPP